MNGLGSLPRRAAALLLSAVLAAPPIAGSHAADAAARAPALLYATYAGPAGSHGAGVATDRAGNVYVVGTAGTIPSSRAWVTKLDPTGTHVLYTFTVGAPCGALGNAIAVDPAGNAYITRLYGARDQYNLCQIVTDVLVAKIDPSGHLVYQKQIGPAAKGSGAVAVTNEGNAIAVDRAGNAYVTGRCDCWAEIGPTLPTTPSAFQRTGHLHDGFGMTHRGFRKATSNNIHLRKPAP